MRRRAEHAAPAAPVELTITALDSAGRGVARGADGKVAFVEGALTGERVMAARVGGKAAFDLMRAVSVLKASAARRPPRCAVFGICGGCATQHADVRTQVAAKQRGLEDCLARIGKVVPEELLPAIVGPEWGYRHRARLSMRFVEKKGGTMVGFHERRSIYVTDMQACEVLPPNVSVLIPEMRAMATMLSIRARLPQVELAVGEAAVVLVFRNLDPLTAEDETVLRAFAEENGVHVWLQPAGPDGASPFHPPDAPLPRYSLPEFGITIDFRPTDFTQVNHAVNRVLVSRAVRFLDPQPGERIADLFCGLGNFTLPIARSGAEVHGWEGSAPLIERARANARANRLDATFEMADLFKPEFSAAFAVGAPFDKLLVDPPRTGAATLMHAMPAAWPRRIVYVSCDPATLARDAGTLVHEKGFRLTAAGIVNMFPHTAHVESMAVFER
ncbi:MAG: 23S rRNA (uracil(1939)-C(5))-methyltransferase RlmD [Proteobacteria bacterium]|nr:23S rRNA (uracil(1939)-C(5))-methyltransferase RlmD [Pseudomonadota bacterium]